LGSWDAFAVIVGGASAALLGLLFVAISIRIGVIAGSRELRNRAAQTLVLFGIVLLPCGCWCGWPGPGHDE